VTGPGDDPAVRIRVSEAVVARLAAHHALQVPGVLALQADLGRTLLAAAGSVFGSVARPAARAGTSATVADGRAVVAVTVVTRLGHNCRDLAQAVQQSTATAVASYTGLQVTVAVTVAEVILD
jgi:uncharacterized alkaline shock family protein YloU